MINRLYTLFLSLFVSLVAYGQTAGTIASKDAMLYDSSRHLYEKGNKLTIVSKDLEWPKGLGGSVLTELQQYLTTFFFGLVVPHCNNNRVEKGERTLHY